MQHIKITNLSLLICNHLNNYYLSLLGRQEQDVTSCSCLPNRLRLNKNQSEKNFPATSKNTKAKQTSLFLKFCLCVFSNHIMPGFSYFAHVFFFAKINELAFPSQLFFSPEKSTVPDFLRLPPTSIHKLS